MLDIDQKNSAYTKHWNLTFECVPEEKLGWFETDFKPTLSLIECAKLPTEARIMIAGAGTTRLIDELLAKGFTNISASDLSNKAIDTLRLRFGHTIDYAVGDLTSPTFLLEEDPVDFWFDRAVLHFFTNPDQLNNYSHLINRLVNPGGYVALAEFAEDGATKCSGLEIRRYSADDLSDFLGTNFLLQHSFRHLYKMPQGELRPYIYALFKRVGESPF